MRSCNRRPALVGHLPGLWLQAGAHIAGRSGAQFIGLLAAVNPFPLWQIEDRYSDGTAITESDARTHLDAASDIVAIHEQARISGAVP